MAQDKVYAVPNPNSPNTPVTIDPENCNGCNMCVEVCELDILIPNPEKGKPPIILHPEECWYGGTCVMVCPRPDAIKLHWPLMQRVHWKNKDTGERFWL